MRNLNGIRMHSTMHYPADCACSRVHFYALYLAAHAKHSTLCRVPLYPLPSTRLYTVEGRGFTPQLVAGWPWERLRGHRKDHLAVMIRKRCGLLHGRRPHQRHSGWCSCWGCSDEGVAGRAAFRPSMQSGQPVLGRRTRRTLRAQTSHCLGVTPSLTRLSLKTC